MAHRPVGTGISMSLAGALPGVTTSFHIQSSVVRITARGSAVHAKISQDVGVTTTAANTDYLIPQNSSATLELTRVSCKVVGISQADGCVITCPEGQQVPFNVGNFVTLKGASESNYNTKIVHSQVTAVDTTASFDGSHQTKLTLDADTSGISTAFSFTEANSDVTLFSSARIGAKSEGTNASIHAIQVQTTGAA